MKAQFAKSGHGPVPPGSLLAPPLPRHPPPPSTHSRVLSLETLEKKKVGFDCHLLGIWKNDAVGCRREAEHRDGGG